MSGAPGGPGPSVSITEAVAFGDGRPLGLIAGPCVIEDRDSLLRTAATLAEVTARLGMPFVFKASYEKDNRSRGESFRGPGLDEGLRLLAEVKAELGVPVLSDVHHPHDVAAAAEVLDVIQIPAFLSRQTSLLEAVGRSGRAVHVKKAQFMAPEAMSGPVDKLRAVGCDRLLLCERGTTFGYSGLVNDFTSLPLMRALGAPVVYDVTHSVRREGPALDGLGGSRGLAPLLMRCGIAAGADALFIETHPDPPRALCDAISQLPLGEMGRLMAEASRLASLVRELGR